MFGLFKKKEAKYNFQSIGVDMHSHILPGIDDGAATVQDSVILVKNLMQLGFTKLIATPHIMADYYRNTPETIHKALEILRNELVKQNISIEVEAAAEYYLDESFLNKIDAGNLLTMGNNYLLFELSFVNYPHNLQEIVQKLNDKGYKPILAHPERYSYLYNSLDDYYKIKSYGCYFQLNTISLNGYYGKQTQKIAEELVDNHLIDFLGSDMHHIRHAEVLKKSLLKSHTELIIQEDVLQNKVLK
jgi:protein-tyrosine phosphatase